MEIYQASDYAGLEAGSLKFYYGYERVICPVHGFHDQPYCPKNEEQETEWAFVAYNNKRVLATYGRNELDNLINDSESTAEYMLAGIAMLIDKGLVGSLASRSEATEGHTMGQKGNQ